MGYKVSADTGGTFIDVVVQDSSSNFVIGKSLTTHHRVFEGLSSALESAASDFGVTARQILDDTDLFVYGTTRATNAIVTRNVAKTALLTTEGFADVLLLKEGGKLDGHDYSKQYPDPYIPRRHTFEVPERVDAQGEVIKSLDENALRTTLNGLQKQGFEAVAVSLLWSIANPEHELRVGKLIEEVLPGIPFSLSHQVSPVIREYRRASATAIDASLKPLMQKHFRELEEDLRDFGYKGRILVSTSIGGVMSVEEVIQSPINTAKSGPAMAPLAGLTYSLQEAFGGNMIVCDTGGTTFDVGMSRDGELVTSRDTWMGPQWEGDLLGISSVDIRSIGAGGGSIAWVDDGGLLHVGPQSAGSEPGPACYGRGGTEPTLSDAACVLGYFDPEFFLGGRMKLDKEAAETAVDKVAKKLDIDVREAAWGILSVASEAMVKAVHEITIAQGLNPRESTLVAGGGAAGINIMQIAKEIGSERALLPKLASGLSASGMHFADVVKEARTSFITNSKTLSAEVVNGVLDGLDGKLKDFADRFAAEDGQFTIDYSVEARYSSQVWTIDLALPSARFAGDGDKSALISEFHKLHERILGVRDDDSTIDFLNWTARITVKIPQTEKTHLVAEKSTATPLHWRPCYFGDGADIDTPIYKPEELKPGVWIEGPAVVEEPSTTLVIFPGMAAEVSDAGNYILHV